MLKSVCVCCVCLIGSPAGDPTLRGKDFFRKVPKGGKNEESEVYGGGKTTSES